MGHVIAGFQPALEGRAIINLQMSDTFAAFQDINASLAVQPTAELYTNRGVINQVLIINIKYNKIPLFSSQHYEKNILWLHDCCRYITHNIYI